MAEFQTITTQAEFDAAIQARLQRERETIEKKFADYETLKQKAADYDKLAAKDYEGQIKKLTDDLKTANGKLSTHDQTVADLTTRAMAAERSVLQQKIAHENKIPYELAGRLAGDTEDAMREDAKTLAKFVTGTQPAPLRTQDGGNGNGMDGLYASLLASLDNNQ